MGKFENYAKKAIEMGALHAKVIKAEDVVVDPRTYIKCMYGCDTWGKNWTCPSAPGALKPWEFEKILNRYKIAILIHCDKKNLSQKISYELETQAFFDGYYFSFSMSDCALCKTCRYPEECKHPHKARPALQGLGIDVYATVRKQGLPIKTLVNKKEKQNWYSIVFIE